MKISIVKYDRLNGIFLYLKSTVGIMYLKTLLQGEDPLAVTLIWYSTGRVTARYLKINTFYLYRKKLKPEIIYLVEHLNSFLSYLPF